MGDGARRGLSMLMVAERRGDRLGTGVEILGAVGVTAELGGGDGGELERSAGG